MSLNSTINSVAGHISDAWEAVEEIGGTVPEQKNLVNLETALEELVG